MELQKQVTSLELSKRLKELGVRQQSIFSWETYLIKEHNPKMTPIHYHNGSVERVEQDTLSNLQYVSAFTVAELGEMLKKFEDLPAWNKRLSAWERELVKGAWISTHFEAEARGRMLEYLITNNLLKGEVQ